MSLNPKTIEILKSFAAINQGMIFRPGNVIRTMAQSKNIFGTATVPDDFPREFAIYNLNEFLSIISLFQAPNIEYGENEVVISEGKVSIRYVYSSPAVVVAPPEGKEIPVKDVQLEFNISKATLQDLLKASAVMKTTDIVISKKGIKAISKKGGDNSYTVDVDDIVGDSTEEFSVKIESLKMIPGDYKVRVTPRVIAFDADGLSYIIALEKSGA